MKQVSLSASGAGVRDLALVRRLNPDLRIPRVKAAVHFDDWLV
jgi:hypothetical protein